MAKKNGGGGYFRGFFLAVRKRHERFENSVGIFLHVAISWLFLKWLFPWLFSWLFLNFAWLFFVYVAISVAIFVAIFQCSNCVDQAPRLLIND